TMGYQCSTTFFTFRAQSFSSSTSRVSRVTLTLATAGGAFFGLALPAAVPRLSAASGRAEATSRPAINHAQGAQQVPSRPHVPDADRRPSEGGGRPPAVAATATWPSTFTRVASHTAGTRRVSRAPAAGRIRGGLAGRGPTVGAKKRRSQFMVVLSGTEST